MDHQAPDPAEDMLSSDILTGMREWRLQHPDATLTEIEQALDERWYRVRARMLQDLALEREAANWQAQATTRPSCPDCGRALIRRGRQPRQLKTHGGQDITLNRTYGYCPTCKKGHFPPR
jgi:ribosomal protein L34E